MSDRNGKETTKEYYVEPPHLLPQVVQDHADRLGRVEETLGEMANQIGPALATLQSSVGHIGETVRSTATDVRNLRDLHQQSQLSHLGVDQRLTSIEKLQAAHAMAHGVTKTQVMGVVKWLAGVGASVLAGYLIYYFRLR